MSFIPIHGNLATLAVISQVAAPMCSVKMTNPPPPTVIRSCVCLCPAVRGLANFSLGQHVSAQQAAAGREECKLYNYSCIILQLTTILEVAPANISLLIWQLAIILY